MLNININYLISATEISIENYCTLKNFQGFYKQVFTCFNICKDLKQINDRSINSESFYYNQFGRMLLSLLKVKRYALMNGLKADYCMLKPSLKKAVN